MEGMVGFEFRPTDDEIVGFYLRNQIEGNTRLVERAITEVNICDFDPWNLRFQSKIKSRDPVWYFFSRRENKYANGTRQNRRTSSGFWKLTGEPVEVKDQWGIWTGIRGRIGYKRCLVFLKGRGSEKTSSDWVMHEFHYDLLPEHKMTYAICRLEYKGDDMNILLNYPTDPTPTFVANPTNSEGSVVDRSFQENSGSFYYPSEYGSANQGQQFGNLTMQQNDPYSDSYIDDPQRIWDYEIINNLEFLVDERTTMQDNRSNHCPKTPITGVFADDSSDSETDSMTWRDTSSSTDSVGSSNELNHTLTDDISSSNTIEPFHNYEARGQPKQPKLHFQGKQKVINTQKRECEWKMAEDSIKKSPSSNPVKHNWIVLEEMSQRNSQWNYLKNMIIGFVLLISIIGWIILV